MTPPPCDPCPLPTTGDGWFWCERHRCKKHPHWVTLCIAGEEYFRAWEEGRGPGQTRPADAAPKQPPDPAAAASRVAQLAVCAECPELEDEDPPGLYCLRDVERRSTGGRVLLRLSPCQARGVFARRLQGLTAPCDRWPPNIRDHPAET
jgi:hypothetical protein